MSLGFVAIACTVLLFILMLLRMPIGAACALSGFIGISIVRGVHPALVNLAMIAETTVTSYQLSVIPVFVLLGALAYRTALSQNAFSTLHKWIGHLRGGLAMACVGACAAFGAVCGSHVATAATMTSAALPEMRRYKYDDELSLGTICAGGNLGILIPPSNAMVLYGFLTQVSIGSLFIAGIIPGLLIMLLFCIQIYIQCRLNPEIGPSGPSWSWGEKAKALKGIWGITLVFILVMGGIYTGIFTPTESAAVGVFVVCIIGLVTRKLTWQGFVDSLLETVKISAMIYFLIIGASIFGTFLTTTEVAFWMADFVAESQMSPYFVLAVVLIVYLILGTYMDAFAVLIMTLPIFYPLVVLSAGFDPVYFGVLCTATIMIASISPPFGEVVFPIAAMVKDVSINRIWRGCMPFIITMTVGLIILAIFPQISTVLPSFMLPYK